MTGLQNGKEPLAQDPTGTLTDQEIEAGGLSDPDNLPLDLEHCSQCGGPLTIIAAIEDPP